MPDATYQPKVYREQGGDKLVVKSGGSIDCSDATGSLVLAAGEIALADIADGILQGSKLANVAESNAVGGIPVVHLVNVPDGATGDIDLVLTYKTRVLDVIVIKQAGAGGAGDTITVKNGANAITDAIDINVADKTVKRAGTIDDAQYEIAAAGTLRVTRTKASANNVACLVVVLGVRVA